MALSAVLLSANRPSRPFGRQGRLGPAFDRSIRTSAADAKDVWQLGPLQILTYWACFILPSGPLGSDALLVGGNDHLVVMVQVYRALDAQ